jgi:hypothetical protein
VLLINVPYDKVYAPLNALHLTLVFHPRNTFQTVDCSKMDNHPADNRLHHALTANVDFLKPSQARLYSSEEWDAQKLLIQQLYRRNTLAQTITILRERGFPVT